MVMGDNLSRFILILCLLFLANPVLSAEFNIKLRKTDINELKQQLLPAFDRNIEYLNTILRCLEQGNTTDNCLQQFPPPGRVSENQSASDHDLKHSIEKNLQKQDLTEADIIQGLKELLQQAEKVRNCLVTGQTANDLKDCIVNYKKT